MKKTIIAAAILLLIQIGLAVTLNISDKSYEAFSPDTPFLQIKADAITSLEITDGEKKQLVLQKNESGWVIPSLYLAPVNKGQLDALLEKLAGMKQGLAVATSALAAKRFKVAEDDFERHVVVREEEKILADFYVGTSPGFRQINARKAGHDEIISIPLSSFELPTSGDKWLDQELLKLKEEEIAEVAFPGFSLTQKDGAWQLDGLEPGQKTNNDEVVKLLAGITELNVQSVVEPKLASDLLAKGQTFRYTVAKKDKSRTEYTFATLRKNFLVLQVTGFAQYFEVNQLQIDPLQKTGRDKLIFNRINP